MVQNIPITKSQEDIKKHFEDLLPKIEIEKVVYAYSISDIISLLRVKNELEDKKTFLEYYKKEKLSKLNKTLQQAEDEGIDLSPPPASF